MEGEIITVIKVWMEGEINNFIKVWFSVFISLCYCYFAGKVVPKGTPRLFTLLPVVCLFLNLPLHLHSMHLGGMTAFFIAWLANFKLLMFAYGIGPLSDPSLSLLHFVAIASLPIKIQQNPLPKSTPNFEKSPNTHLSNGHFIENPCLTTSKNGPIPNSTPYLEKSMNTHLSNGHGIENPSLKTSKNGPVSNSTPDFEKSTNTHLSNGHGIENPYLKISKKGHKSPLNYAIKSLLLASFLRVYDYSDYIHPKVIWFVYCFHIYFCLEIILAIVAALARASLGLELEPQFNEPYLSTSLQDFWGRRWNIMVTRILRPTVYNPVLKITTEMLSRQWAPLPAILATFMVSALMHELILYYLGRVRPTWEMTWFFLLHGVCLVLEIAIKKLVGDRWRLPREISGPLTLGFVVATGFWLFLPELLRCDADVRAFKEYAAVGAFVKDIFRPSGFKIFKS